MTDQEIRGDDIGDLNFSVDISSPDPEALKEGFNRHGVKDTEDRVEFVFEAMQPGMRNGVKITEDFLQQVAENHENEAPLQLNHDRSMQANVGRVEDVWFSDGALRLRGYVPKTGADTHEEFVNRLTYDPPQAQNGSVGFGMQYEMTRDDDGNPMLADGTMQEFSFTPFPGGYDEDTGGLKAQFEQAYQQYKDEGTPDDDASEGTVSGAESADFSLVTETLHQIDNMSFERIEFDELPEDLPEEVQAFIADAKEQHNENIEFIESVIEARDEAEDEAEEYREQVESLKAEFAESLAERETVPLSADELKDFSLSRLHEMDEETAPEPEQEFEGEDPEEDPEEGADFGSKERKSGDLSKDFTDEKAKEGLDNIPGIVVE